VSLSDTLVIGPIAPFQRQLRICLALIVVLAGAFASIASIAFLTLAAIVVWRRWARRRHVLGRAAAGDRTQPGPYCAVTPIRPANAGTSTTPLTRA
jgi:hypothetical protein